MNLKDIKVGDKLASARSIGAPRIWFVAEKGLDKLSMNVLEWLAVKCKEFDLK